MSHAALLINGVWQLGCVAAFSKTDQLDNLLLWRAHAADASDVAAACAVARTAFCPGRTRRLSNASKG